MDKQTATAISQTSIWTADADHSRVRFKVKHMMIADVHGEFSKFDVRVDYNEEYLTKSRVQVTIDTTSLTTYNEKRDAHLKSPDFFNVEKYPTILFISKRIESTGEGLKMTGDLTIHGVTKPITLDVTEWTKPIKDLWGGMRMAATAAGVINRYDYGLTWNVALEAGGLLVGKEITMMIEVELVGKSPSAEQ